MGKVFREGFTLVELALSMAFVGILSISVVLIISDTVASYRRGLTLAQINSTGMDIVDDMRLAVTNSSERAVTEECTKLYLSGTIRDKCVQDGAYSFVSLVKTTETVEIVKKNGEKDTLTNVPIYGAFCTGTYSYIWNSGYYEMKEAHFKEKDTVGEQKWAKLIYNTTYINVPTEVDIVGSLVKDADFNNPDGDGVIRVGWEEKPFRLLKIHDTDRAVCLSVARPADADFFGNIVHTKYLTQRVIDRDYGGLSGVFDIREYGVLEEQPEDLILASSGNNLALFDLYVAKPAESTTQKNMLYSVSFILGTADGGANIQNSGRTCIAPMDYDDENYDYCAINKFNFAVQASGEL